MIDCGMLAGGRSPKAIACPERIQELRSVHCRNLQVRQRNSDVSQPIVYAVAASTSFVVLAARLFFLLLKIFRSMIAPQLTHFHA
jgi:hypothetical protein